MLNPSLGLTLSLLLATLTTASALQDPSLEPRALNLQPAIPDDHVDTNFPMSFAETLTHGYDARSLSCIDGVKLACYGASSSSCSGTSCKVCCNDCCHLVTAPAITTCNEKTPITRFRKKCQSSDIQMSLSQKNVG